MAPKSGSAASANIIVISRVDSRTSRASLFMNNVNRVEHKRAASLFIR